MHEDVVFAVVIEPSEELFQDFFVHFNSSEGDHKSNHSFFVITVGVFFFK